MSAKRWRYAVTAVLLLALAVVVGCSRARNDAQIAGEVQTRIQSDPSLAGKAIGVTSNNGVVTLSGMVGSEMERQAAANSAAQVAGVKTVVNNLQAQAPEMAQAEPPMEEAAPPRRAAVTTSPGRRASYDRRRVNPQLDAVPPPIPVTAPVRNAPPPPPPPVTIPEGTAVSIRMIDSVESAQNQPGDTFRATLESPIMVGDQVVVPHGANVLGRVVELKSAGRLTGRSEIALELESISYNGKRYQVQSDQYARQGSSRGKRTAATVGGGAAVGAIIGGIAGGGKGAAIGAAVGAGAGTGVQAATKGQQISIKSETVLRFRLQAPVTVTPAASVERAQREEPVEAQREFNDQEQLDEEEQAETNPPVLRRRP